MNFGEKSKLVSVIIPTYNRKRLLSRAVKSVLNQSYSNLECIIVDDASSDETREVINSFQDDRIIYFRHEENKGASAARNTGIKKSQGEFIAFLDDDDLWFPEKLNKQLNKIESSNCDFVMCNYKVNNQINQIQYTKNLNAFADDFLYHIIRRPGPFLQCCLFQKHFLLKNLHLFDSRATPSEDWDFFISLSALNPAVENIDASLFQWNLSKKSQSANYQNEAAAIEYIINKHYHYILNNSSYKHLSFLYSRAGCMFFHSDQHEKCRHYFKKSFRLYPASVKNILYKTLCFFPEFIQIKIMSLFVKKII